MRRSSVPISTRRERRKKNGPEPTDAPAPAASTGIAADPPKPVIPTPDSPPTVPIPAAKPPEKPVHPEALGRSVGGHTTKVHAVCDAFGLPIRFLLTGGEVHESRMAQSLIEGLHADYLLADKGYDSNDFIAEVERAGMTVVIPSKRNRLQPRTYDKAIYRERNQIERLFNRLKNCRRMATRYEKTARNFLAMLQLAGMMLWLA